MSDPRLPGELERIIFIDAFLLREENPISLLLVATRVRDWLIPFIYRVVTASRLPGVRRSDPWRYPKKFTRLAAFEHYGSHIRYLWLGKLWTNTPSECLSYCPHVTDLVLPWLTPPHVPFELLENLQKLTKLSINARYLVNELSMRTRRIPAFPNITHLVTFAIPPFDNIEDVFVLLARHFPSLTHLAVSDSMEFPELVFRQWENLKALVFWRSGSLLRLYEGWVPPTNYDRVVMIRTTPSRDWERSAMGMGFGMWELADEVVKKRVQDKTQQDC
ncbi:hypothetical protein BDN72DRAFT_845196 [Pluteus cervinus]|uniref:Uncharacterized protein n=1 Tax=Pluteus cervinus TaxID=181527 RepID=A0ACD3AJ08_9AGAR|nr:hypothetical protein BDN72DRAFT_845196 [Pluteus cervinus]